MSPKSPLQSLAELFMLYILDLSSFVGVLLLIFPARLSTNRSFPATCSYNLGGLQETCTQRDAFAGP